MHYLDNKTDRTLFIDTGKAIAVRKSAMTVSSVEIMLAPAKEKFGSTLPIKGSQAFKDQIIEVVAQKNLDIHFTDKAMNQQLKARKVELEIERGGQRSKSLKTLKPTGRKTKNWRRRQRRPPPRKKSLLRRRTAHSSELQPGSEKAQKRVYQGVLLEHGAVPYKFKPDMNKPEGRRDDSYFVKLQTTDGKNTDAVGY